MGKYATAYLQMNLATAPPSAPLYRTGTNMSATHIASTLQNTHRSMKTIQLTKLFSWNWLLNVHRLSSCHWLTFMISTLDADWRMSQHGFWSSAKSALSFFRQSDHPTHSCTQQNSRDTLVRLIAQNCNSPKRVISLHARLKNVATWALMLSEIITELQQSKKSQHILLQLIHR